MPFELHPYPEETLKPEERYLEEGWAKNVYPTAERYGVKIVLPRVSPQPHTQLAFEGFQYAKEHGKGIEYNRRMFQAFFQEEQDIGNLDLLTKLAGEIGLNENEYKEVLETGKYREVHRQALIHAYHEADITAVPTFFIGRYKIPGLLPRETLEQVIDQEIEFQKQSTPSPISGQSCGIDGCE
jgi:predicted DsbA family dithiol-disulfide isomerase